MALVQSPFAPPDGSLLVTDGSGLLNFTVPYEDGGITWSEISHRQKNLIHFFTRGRYFGSREEQDRILEFSFDAFAVGFTDASEATLLDVVNRAGTWSNATATLPSTAGGLITAGTAGIYTVQLKWTGERTNFGGAADSSFTMKYAHLTLGFGEAQNGAKFQIKGISLPYSNDYHSWT